MLPKLLPLSPNRPSPLCSSIRSAGGCERTRTAQGRGRHFLRLALQGKVLAVAVRQLAQTPRLLEVRHGGELLPTGGGLWNGGVICAIHWVSVL